jgi:hypothetical protein
MIARRIPTIMPPLGEASLEALAVIYARANMQAPGDDEDWAPKKRPFRAPHHTVSRAGLLGSKGRPGELELATYGVLFLDELEEFPKRNLMALGSTLRQEKHFVIVIASCTQSVAAPAATTKCSGTGGESRSSAKRSTSSISSTSHQSRSPTYATSQRAKTPQPSARGSWRRTVAKPKKPTIKFNATLVEVGRDEDYECNVLRFQVAGAREPIVTIPVTQAQVKKMAPYLYEKVTFVMEPL